MSVAISTPGQVLDRQFIEAYAEEQL